MPVVLVVEYIPDVDTFRAVPEARRWSSAVIVAITALVLAGCATMTNGPTGDIARSISDVASATETASLAFEQHQDEQSTDAVTGTALDDMLDEILTAQTTVAELETTTNGERDLLTEALTRIRGCVDAINVARQTLADPSIDAAPAADGLAAATDEATALSDELGQYR